MLRNMNKLAYIITVAFLAVGCNFEVDKPPTHGHEPSQPTSEQPQPQPQPEPGVTLSTEIQISSDFSAEEQEGILEAISTWSDRTYGAANLLPVIGSNQDHPCQINPVDSFAPEEVHRAGRVSGSGTRCSIQMATSVVKLVSERKTWDPKTQTFSYDNVDGITGVARQFATNELGTLFGIPVLPSGIMAESYSNGEDLDNAALEAFCGIHSCPNGFKATAQ